MSAIAPLKLFTPEDLLHLPDAVGFELVDGNLVERNMGMESSGIAARIIVLLGKFIFDHKLGLLFGSDAGFQCFPAHPNMVRRPDVSFIRTGRLRDDLPPKGHCLIAPDLAVEVISPNDLAYDVEEKVAQYLAAGVPLVWVVNPPTRSVRIHRPRSSRLGSVSELSVDDAIAGEDVLPGFSIPIEDFFPHTSR